MNSGVCVQSGNYSLSDCHYRRNHLLIWNSRYLLGTNRTYCHVNCLFLLNFLLLCQNSFQKTYSKQCSKSSKSQDFRTRFSIEHSVKTSRWCLMVSITLVRNGTAQVCFEHLGLVLVELWLCLKQRGLQQKGLANAAFQYIFRLNRTEF